MRPDPDSNLHRSQKAHHAGRPPLATLPLAALLGLCCLVGSQPALAQDGQALKQAIDKQQSAVAATRSHQKQVQQALNQLQIDIANRQTRIDQLKTQSDAIQQSLSDLNKQQDRLRQHVTTLKRQISLGLRAAYQLGDGAAIGALLARSDALSTERDLHYLRDLIHPTVTRLTQLRQARQQLKDNRQQLVQARDQLSQTRQQLTAQQQDLQGKQIQKQKLLAQLDDKLKAQSKRLQNLLDRKRTLDDQVARANRRAAKSHAKHAEPATPTPPAHSDSDHAIPVGGKIIRHYGSALGVGGLHAQGITFAAPAGRPVRAVAGGKVVYAGQLKGWGKLVIVRHAHNYLSLYAHTDHLAVKHGMRVHQGEVVGSTGQLDAHRTGVYFEVRHGDDAVNPRHWHPYRVARHD